MVVLRLFPSVTVKCLSQPGLQTQEQDATFSSFKWPFCYFFSGFAPPDCTVNAWGGVGRNPQCPPGISQPSQCGQGAFCLDQQCCVPQTTCTDQPTAAQLAEMSCGDCGQAESPPRGYCNSATGSCCCLSGFRGKYLWTQGCFVFMFSKNEELATELSPIPPLLLNLGNCCQLFWTWWAIFFCLKTGVTCGETICTRSSPDVTSVSSRDCDGGAWSCMWDDETSLVGIRVCDPGELNFRFGSTQT